MRCSSYSVECPRTIPQMLSLGSPALLRLIPGPIFWLLTTTNAFNLIDGLDGLAAGVGIGWDESEGERRVSCFRRRRDEVNRAHNLMRRGDGRKVSSVDKSGRESRHI